MTNIELKEALKNRRPIIAYIRGVGECFYSYVDKVMYAWGGTLNKGRIICSAQLKDKNKNSVTIAPANQIRYATEEEIKNHSQRTTANCE